MRHPSLLLSIRPEYAESIFGGIKRVELRRLRPKVSRGDWVLVYVSSPTKALVGTFEVEGVIEERPHVLWTIVGEDAGLSRKRFKQYFAGADFGYAIKVGRIRLFRKAHSLAQLRARIPGFHPPQSYRYLRGHDFARITALG